jgi:hypothetical protein
MKMPFQNGEPSRLYYTQAELIGRNCRFLQGPETSRETVAELRQAVAERLACSR